MEESGEVTPRNTCKECNKTFSNASNLKAHLRTHQGVRAYACSFCKWSFHQHAQLQRHVTKLHGNRLNGDGILGDTDQGESFECRVCHKVYVSFRNLLLHDVEVHQKYEQPACHHCETRCEDVEELLTHYELRHSEEVSIKDSRHLKKQRDRGVSHHAAVDKSTKIPASLTETNCSTAISFQNGDHDVTGAENQGNQLNERSLEELNEKVSCKICCHSFTSVENLASHIAKEHLKDGTTCIKCGKVYLKAKMTRQHIMLLRCKVFRRELQSDGVRLSELDPSLENLTCSVCNVAFSRPHNLAVHMRKHTREKPFGCQHCAKVFQTAGNLRVHLRTVHEHNPAQLPSASAEKKFRCDVCEGMFTSNFKLKIHKRIHEGNKPHTCEHCGMSFTQKGNLTIHLRRRKNGVCARKGQLGTTIGDMFHVPTTPNMQSQVTVTEPPETYMEKFSLKKLPEAPLVVLPTGLYKVYTLPSLPCTSGTLGMVNAMDSGIPNMTTLPEEQGEPNVDFSIGNVAEAGTTEVQQEFMDVGELVSSTSPVPEFSTADVTSVATTPCNAGCNGELGGQGVNVITFDGNVEALTDEASLLAMINDPTLMMHSDGTLTETSVISTNSSEILYPQAHGTNSNHESNERKMVQRGISYMPTISTTSSSMEASGDSDSTMRAARTQGMESYSFNRQEVNVISCLSAAFNGAGKSAEEEGEKGQETNVITSISALSNLDALTDHLHGNALRTAADYDVINELSEPATPVTETYNAAKEHCCETNAIKTRAIVCPKDLKKGEVGTANDAVLTSDRHVMNNNETNVIKGLLSSFELPPTYLHGDKSKSPTKKKKEGSFSSQPCREVTVITETPGEREQATNVIVGLNQSTSESSPPLENTPLAKSGDIIRYAFKASNQTNVIKQNRKNSICNYVRRASTSTDDGSNFEYGIPLPFDSSADPFDGSPSFESIEEELAPYENRSTFLDLDDTKGLEAINFNLLYQGLFNSVPTTSQSQSSTARAQVIVNNTNIDSFLNHKTNVSNSIDNFLNYIEQPDHLTQTPGTRSDSSSSTLINDCENDFSDLNWYQSNGGLVKRTSSIDNVPHTSVATVIKNVSGGEVRDAGPSFSKAVSSL